MSTVKSPKEKKRLSLTRDCRNVYGENPAASRKGIAKGKQRQHQNERRSAAQVLAQLNGNVDEDTASNVELQAKVAVAVSRRYRFKKSPDVSSRRILGAQENMEEGGRTSEGRS